MVIKKCLWLSGKLFNILTKSLSPKSACFKRSNSKEIMIFHTTYLFFILLVKKQIFASRSSNKYPLWESPNMCNSSTTTIPIKRKEERGEWNMHILICQSRFQNSIYYKKKNKLSTTLKQTACIVFTTKSSFLRNNLGRIFGLCSPNEEYYCK